MLKRLLNLDLLEFHVREATQELDLLQDAIQYAKGGTLREGAVGDEPLRWPLREGALAASLEHAYHHLNFPRPRDKCGWFAKCWPKSLL